MKLIDLDPRWVDAGGEGISRADGSPAPERTGVGIMFDCPCGCDMPCYVGFKNPIDGGEPHCNPGEPLWQRASDTFDALTLLPSILRTPSKGGCGWHGFIANGEIITC